MVFPSLSELSTIYCDPHSEKLAWSAMVHKAQVDFFLELSCFIDDPADVGNLISGSSAFSKYDTFLKSKHEMKSILYTCGVLDI